MLKFCLPHRVLCLMFIKISQNFVNIWWGFIIKNLVKLYKFMMLSS